MKKFDHHKWAVEFSETDPLPDDFHQLELWALSLLKGFDATNENGGVNHIYLSTEEEPPYRRALAQILRSDKPLYREIRLALADLVCDGEFPGDREIRFHFKKPGRSRDHAQRSAIANMVLSTIKEGGSETSGIRAASAAFGREQRHVRRIFAEYRPHFLASGELPGSGSGIKSRNNAKSR